jgi:hypothetical protein
MFYLNKTRLFWGGFILVVVFVFFPNLVSAQVLTFPDVSITNYGERVFWDVYKSIPSGSAIVQGKLSMNVSGISDDNGSSEYGKLNLFGMVDSGQGTDMNDRSYWLQVRRNTSEYAGILPQISVKGRIDCTWFGGDSSNLFDHAWDPTQSYRMELSWNRSEATLLVTGDDGLSISATAVFPKPFAPQQQAVYFGSSPASIAYEALPASYSNIVLDAQVIEPSKAFTVERCPIEDEEDQDDPNNPYDTCSCHAIPDVNTRPPCEDPVDRTNPREIRVLQSNFPFDFSFGGVRINWLWTLDDLAEEAKVKNEQTMSLPEVDLEFSSPSLMSGEINSAIALTTNYRSRMQNMYYGWCAIVDGVTYPMNSIAAGGQLLPELTSPSMTWADGACCQPITRIPPNEYDYKGMDIRWLERHFVGRTINGVTYTNYTQVDPNDDPDSDGYLAHTFRNEKGEYMTVSPYLVDKYGNTYNPGAEGRLTNIMEYILDTDPLNGDTDGDGYSDGMDFIGVGQTQLDFMVTKLAGPDGYYDISVAVLGTNEAKKVSISGTKKRVFINAGGKLEVKLSADKEIMTFDDSQPLKISTAIVSGEGSVEDLTYEWFFNNQSVCDGGPDGFPELCDVGQIEVIFGDGGISFFNLPEPIGLNYPISVRVVSLETGSEATATINMPMATPVNLVTADCSGQSREIDSLVAGTSNPVAVCISEIEELAAADLNSYNFIWELDGQQDIEQSGSGKSEFMLLPKKPAGNNHNLSVTVKEVGTGSVLVNGQRSFSISGPEIKIVEPETPNYDESTAGKYRFTTFPAGHDISFRAELRNLVSLGVYEVQWDIDGQVMDTQIVEGFETFFTYQIPETASDGTTFNVGLTVRSLDLNINEQGSDQIKIAVGVPTASVGEIASVVGNLAAAFTKIPLVFREVIKYAAIMAVVFFGLVYFYPKFSRFLDK